MGTLSPPIPPTFVYVCVADFALVAGRGAACAGVASRSNAMSASPSRPSSAVSLLFRRDSGSAFFFASPILVALGLGVAFALGTAFLAAAVLGFADTDMENEPSSPSSETTKSLC